MPYRKIQSHQERIPWISAHPLDVKKGTFVGEMSRLATLSSLWSHYSEAIRGLTALYIKRGYPQKAVMSWVNDNLNKRWENRLRVFTGERQEVLVLKSEYNPAWNYFNASQLQDVIFGYWREYLNRYDRGEFSIHYPIPKGPLPDDLRKTSILNRRLLVSKKRTRNLFDLASLWKRTVLSTLDERVGQTQLEDYWGPRATAVRTPASAPEPVAQVTDTDVDMTDATKPSALVEEFLHTDGPSRTRDDSSDEDVNPRRRSPPPPPGWRQAAW